MIKSLIASLREYPMQDTTEAAYLIEAQDGKIADLRVQLQEAE